MNHLDAALKYAELGWHVFPCMRQQKVPATKRGVKDATADIQQIQEWWKANPLYNIGVACGEPSGVYVVDVDVSAAGDVDGYKSLREFPALPPTVWQATPRGGFHAFYRTDTPPANKNSYRPGIDIRGTGYYVVLAPSIHPNGGTYKWNPGRAPWESELAEFPDFLRPPALVVPQRGRIAGGPAGAGELGRASAYLETCDPAIQGQGGHDKLLWAAGAMIHRFGLSDNQALEILAREYNPRCVPPWNLDDPKDYKDFARKVTEARSHPPACTFLLPDEDIDLVDWSAIKANIKRNTPALPQADKTELEYLSNPPFLLGDICEWLNKTSMRRQPFLSVACALTYSGALFGRKVRDYTGARTNIYAMGIGKSSSGKNHGPKQIRKLAAATGSTYLIGGNEPASDASIESRLSRQASTLFLWDEIGFLLTHIKAGLSPHHARIISSLMQLYSAADSIYLGREYADQKNQRVIVEPCCCVYGMSTPERFVEGITPGELHDGWLSRCLVFVARDRPRKKRAHCALSPPDSVCEQIYPWLELDRPKLAGTNMGPAAVYHGASETITPSPPKTILVPYTNEADARMVTFDDESEEYGRQWPQTECLWAKAEELARRIALIVASGKGKDGLGIDLHIAEYSCCLVKHLLFDFAKEVIPSIVSSAIDQKKQKLIRVIGQAGKDGCSRTHLTNRSQWCNRRERNELLSDLIEANRIMLDEKPGSKGQWFWTVDHYMQREG